MNLKLVIIWATILLVTGSLSVASSPGKRCTISGVVSRIDGRPVDQAWVKLIQREKGALFVPKGQELLATIMTNRSGEFRLHTDKWNDQAIHELIVGGTSRQQPPIRNETVTQYYVLTTHINIGARHVILVPNDFVPNRRDPRRGFLDLRAYERG
jgi:hypothetical protein